MLTRKNWAFQFIPSMTTSGKIFDAEWLAVGNLGSSPFDSFCVRTPATKWNLGDSNQTWTSGDTRIPYFQDLVTWAPVLLRVSIITFYLHLCFS